MTTFMPEIYSQSHDVFTKKVQDFLNFSDQKADGILSGKKSSSSDSFAPMKFSNIHIGNSYSGLHINSNNTTNVHQSSRQESENALRLMIGLVSTIVIGAGSWFIGSYIGKIQETSKELNYLETFKEKMKKVSKEFEKQTGLKLAEANDHFSKIREVMKANLEITSHSDWSQKATLIATISLVAGAALALSGVLFASAATMLSLAAVGTAVGVVSMAFLIGKWGYESSSSQERKAAMIMKEKIAEINSDLEKYEYQKKRF